VQLAGPYRRWEHTHRLTSVDGGTEIHDRVVYRLPFEPLAGLVAPVTVGPWLRTIFDYRARQTAARLR
jgi:ligand-binding SRPBCC domain-containing protein